ncbi:hypothetical protein [Actinoplanes auranticolor]|nr:hypothetical protein [Actinoplanes auranticolor]
MRVVKLAAGLAVGYVLGARAGREKYEQIAATVRTVSGRPAETDPQSSPEPEAGVAALSADVAAGERPTPPVAGERPTPPVAGDKQRRPRNRPKKAAARTAAAGSAGSAGESSVMSTADLGIDSIPLEASEADVIEQKMPVVDRSDDPTDPSPVLETDAADAREQRRS